jgi:hypothetical protein
MTRSDSVHGVQTLRERNENLQNFSRVNFARRRGGRARRDVVPCADARWFTYSSRSSSGSAAPRSTALMPISKMPWAELNRRGHNRPEPFLQVQIFKIVLEQKRFRRKVVWKS